MNVQELMNLTPEQIDSMSDSELRKATTILNSAANKRIKRAYQAGNTSKVMDDILEEGKFSIKGASSRREIMNDWERVHSFMGKQTSSLTGTRKAQSDSFKALAQKINNEMKPSQKLNPENWTQDKTDSEIKDLLDLVWTQVDKLSEDPTKIISDANKRYQLAEKAFDIVSRSDNPITTKDELFEFLSNYYEANYKNKVEHADDEITDKTGAERRIEEEFGRKPTRGNSFT